MNVIHTYGVSRFRIQRGLNQVSQTKFETPLLGYIIECDHLQPETDRHEKIGAAHLDWKKRSGEKTFFCFDRGHCA